MKIPNFSQRGPVDIQGLRETLAEFEKLATEQAHLPVEERLSVEYADGTVVVDAIGASIQLCRRLIAEAEGRKN